AKHDFGARFIGDDVRGAAAGEGPDIKRGGAKQGGDRQGELADSLQRIEERGNGGGGGVWVGGGGGVSARDEFVTQRTFRTESKLVFRRLAVDEKAGTTGSGSGGFRADAVALFADDEEQGEIVRAGREKRFGGGDHGGDDALGVTRPAA